MVMENKLNILCVTNKKAVKENFLTRIETLLKGNIYALILREKDLSAQDFKKLAIDINFLCMQHKTPLFLNAYFADFTKYTIPLAQELKCNIHTGFENYLLAIKENIFAENSSSTTLGISIHSLQEADFIKKNYYVLPVKHIIAGHIFNTNCKQGMKGRGLSFLQNISSCMRDIPKPSVFAIGGITPERVPSIMEQNINGIALMSSLMEVTNPLELLIEFQKNATITQEKSFSKKDSSK